MKKRVRLKPLAKTILVVIILELILISYLFLYSKRVEEIDKQDNEVVSVYVRR